MASFEPPLGKQHLAGFGVGGDVPGLRPGLAPVEDGCDQLAGGSTEVDVGGDRRIPIVREVERGGGDEHRRQDVGGDRERVDAGIEHPKTACAPDPVLVRMPTADVFLPVDGGRSDPGRCEECARCLYRRRATRVPAREERDAFGGGERFQILDLADGRAWRLFQKNMLAGFERGACSPVADLRRHAERYCIDLPDRIEHVLDGLEVADALDRCVRARRGDKLVVLVSGKRRKMLVADDLADADDGEPDGRFL